MDLFRTQKIGFTLCCCCTGQKVSIYLSKPMGKQLFEYSIMCRNSLQEMTRRGAKTNQFRPNTSGWKQCSSLRNMPNQNQFSSTQLHLVQKTFWLGIFPRGRPLFPALCASAEIAVCFVSFEEGIKSSLTGQIFHFLKGHFKFWFRLLDMCSQNGQQKPENGRNKLQVKS